jgi:hypothetical protein
MEGRPPARGHRAGRRRVLALPVNPSDRGAEGLGRVDVWGMTIPVRGVLDVMGDSTA